MMTEQSESGEIVQMSGKRRRGFLSRITLTVAATAATTTIKCPLFSFPLTLEVGIKVS